jgi:hypothetical protein
MTHLDTNLNSATEFDKLNRYVMCIGGALTFRGRGFEFQSLFSVADICCIIMENLEIGCSPFLSLLQCFLI